MKVLELFSGIGGMHFAFEESGIPGEVIAAADINTVANCVYRRNFETTTLLQNNIQSFTADFINKMAPDMILMSPPCQPFTRTGLKKDSSDNRSDALIHLISVLPNVNRTLSYVLVENVKGFETSDSCSRLVKVLNDTGFTCQQFLLSPVQFSVPNSRERYYLLAKRGQSFLGKRDQNIVMTSLPAEFSRSFSNGEARRILDILEFDDCREESYRRYLVSDKNLKKRTWIYDIVTKDSVSSCCFTKAYTHYAEGTGSVYCPLDRAGMDRVFKLLDGCPPESPHYDDNLKKLRLRYFTPREVSRLMCFPEEFQFPDDITDRQRYRLLGNSINVKVVSTLIKYLCSKEESENRVRCCEWMRKLSSIPETSVENANLKNEYMQYLRITVRTGFLHGIFLNLPPKGPLRPLAEALGNHIVSVIPELQDFGPIAPYVLHRSADGRAYVSIKKLPGYGLFCYMAVSPEGGM